MPIKLNGATNGSVELDVPAAVGSDLQVTLPATAGEVVVKDGSGNITTTGSATFGGNVSSGPWDGGNGGNNTGGVKLYDSGLFYANRPTSLSDQSVFKGSVNAVEKVDIKANGSATFADDVSIGGSFISDRTSGAVFYGRQSGVNKVSLFADGSAEFGGTVKASSYIQVNRADAGDYILEGQDNGTQTTLIQKSGNVTFAGLITGRDYVAQRSDSDSIELWRGLQTNGTVSSRIYGDGSTEFRGRVKVDRSVATNAVLMGQLNSATTTQIRADGNATFSGNITAGNVSDIKFKENITDATSQLVDTVALGSQLKNWDWKDDAPLNEELRAKRFLGLVAQEAEKVCPSLTYTVPRTKQGAELTPETTDAEGVVTPATYEELDDSYKAINHDILVMKLLGAVAEQNTQIETLKTKVAALEATS